jgi:hypothetical protein
MQRMTAVAKNIQPAFGSWPSLYPLPCEIPFAACQSPPHALCNLSRLRLYGKGLPQDPPSFRVFVPLGQPDAEPVRDFLIRASSSNNTSPPRDGGIKITSLLGDQASIARQERDTSRVALRLSERQQLSPQILTCARAHISQPVPPIGHR